MVPAHLETNVEECCNMAKIVQIDYVYMGRNVKNAECQSWSFQESPLTRV